VSKKNDLEPTEQALLDGLRVRNSRALAKAITLIESTRCDHQLRAARLLDAVLPLTGRSIRIGITGSPGSGKSTFIECLGLYLVEQGHRPAVLAIDPSSSLSGGSLLGDKTRMEQLSHCPDAFIRGSPSGASLGGVSERTREALLLCEAAGFDVVLVETVGVGQSETAVAGMVDIFVLLQLPHAGDELQALKKGIVELADIIVVHKADLDAELAELARQQFEGAVALLRGRSPAWRPPVLTLSSATRTGIDRFWAEVQRYREAMSATREFEENRKRQAVDWMWTLIDSGLRQRFRQHPQVRCEQEAIRRAVAAGEMTPATAAERLLGYLGTT
jgi:LAO/AO transport system kinase